MKRISQLAVAIFLFSIFNPTGVGAQTRYLDEVSTNVTVTSNVVYGNNLWCTILGNCDNPTANDLKMDVYEPAGDSLTERPLIIIMHTGNFLTPILNGGPTGSKTDSVVVEMCTRFAKKGYVAIAMDYRLGWNPVSTNQDVRTSTIINAVYRVVQDAHTCIRFFKKDVDIGVNTYGIDTSRIVLGGIGSGGYISLAFASFDKWCEIYLAKLINFNTSPPEPYIDTSLSGDFKGLLARYLNIPNHVGYNSDVNMVFNMGGALGDSSWMEVGNVPTVSFATTNDPNAPYTYGVVIVPTTGDIVLWASGSYDIVRRANYLCNNNIFKMSPAFSDVYTVRANVNNDGYEGLFPFVTPPPGGNTCSDGSIESEQGSPWDWWDEVWYENENNTYGKDGPLEVCKARLSNPDMSAAKGRAYVDTVQGYLVPRIYRVLFDTAIVSTGCTPVNTSLPSGSPCLVSVEEIDYASSLTIYPNPSSSSVTVVIENTAEPIIGIELYDVTGRLLISDLNIRTNKYVMEKNDLSSGLYFINVRFEDGNFVNKIVFE